MLFIMVLQTNGEEQSKFLVHYIETKKQDSFSKVKMISDFAGIHRFITGFRGRWSVTERAKEIKRKDVGGRILFSWVWKCQLWYLEFAEWW